MYKCTLCNGNFNDGVKCSACGQHLDFNCASISEAGWRKLGVERRATWRCSSCKAISPAPVVKEQVTLESLLREIRDIKIKLTDLPMLVEDVRSIKDEIQELKTSCDFSSAKLDEVTLKLNTVETTVAELQQKQAVLESNVSEMQTLVFNSEQRSRLNNVEIKGVPLKQNENLFQIIDKICTKTGYTFPQTQINYISRIPAYNTKNKSIVVSFVNRYIKEDFIASARALKTLSSEDLGFHNAPGRIFVNDHLTADSKLLLNKVRQMAKDKNYTFVWVKFSKIHVRKSESSRSFIITKVSDLNKIV